MVNRSKARGTSWESAIVNFLVDQGWPYCERRTLSGAQDKGDIAGIPGVMIEAKSTKTITLGTFIKEVEVEQDNAKARVGVAWIKRVGKSSPADGYVVMTGTQFAYLLKEAGF